MLPGAPKYTPGPSWSTVVTVPPDVAVHVVVGAKNPASRSACVTVCRADVHVYAARGARSRKRQFGAPCAGSNRSRSPVGETVVTASDRLVTVNEYVTTSPTAYP